MSPLQIWNTLGRRSKLALAARDRRELADVFGCPRTVDRTVSEVVLEWADKFAAKFRR